MKNILIYGDSNTWGDNFITGIRIPFDKRWPNILQKKLGNEYRIFQEGLPGRVAGNCDVEKKFKNGKDTFIATFRTQAPVDVIIIALGTNDLQIKYNRKVEDIIEDLEWYTKILMEMFNDEDDKIKYFNNKFPDIIYILPSNFDYLDKASVVFDSDSEKKRKIIIDYFRNKKYNIIYSDEMSLFDDGLHFDYATHERMALLVGKRLTDNGEQD